MFIRDTEEVKNMYKMYFEGVGKYDIPEIKPVVIDEPIDLVGFNYAKTCDDKGSKTVHFYLDDYQFERVWQKPEKYVELIKQFKYAHSPDFSLYADYPKAVQIYNHYRKHWIGAYLNEEGVAVIPTISWSTPDSYEWCFDGEPKGSTVSVSTIGCMRTKESINLFEKGFDKMMEVLEPHNVIAFGISFGELRCMNDNRVVKYYRSMSARN